LRARGELESVGGLEIHDHVCLCYEDDEGLRDAAVEFLGDGRRRGERMMYVGAEQVPALRDHLAALEDRDSMLGDGSLLVLSLPSIYRLGRPIDPAAQIEIYLDAIDEALADGYSGLRVVADVTALVTVPAVRDAHVHWEGFADDVIAERQMSVMCCYDRRALPKAVITDIADAHPAVCG
jgi:hypothetical protein